MIELDRRLERWVVEHRVFWLDQVFVWLSRLGTFGGIFLAVALLAAVVRRKPELLVVTLAAALAADALDRGLKAAVGRARPPAGAVPPPLVRVPSDGSFPSGHAAVGFACAVSLALALPRLAVPLLLLAGAIAYSRVYLGVHYPLDVVGGAALGAAVATALRRLAGALTRSRRPPPPG
ncbi:MAG TPA: phosphatase PAP2 family protein [Gaiellaceae bacterium]|nr:phosphatase PAP2 family protein [Gaiellaceae bacterium]